MSIASSWDYDPTSKHQMMKILSKHNEILWINYHGSRRPAVNRIDIKDSWAALRRVAQGLRRVAPSIVQMTPLVVPGASSAVLRWLHRWALIAQIRRAIRVVAAGRTMPVQVWTFAPDVPYLVGAFEEECFLYYCVDDYTQFKGFDTKHIEESEGELIRKADVVVTTSQPLLESKRLLKPGTILLRHGVDYDHFAVAWRSPPPCPPDLAGVGRPIFGFFGVVHHWIDRELIAQVARRRPQYSFVLIGECKADVSALKSLDNVFLLGRRPYQDLPAYCAAFDAALLPFVRCPMTRSVNPIKMSEYLAAGLPVISTRLPEAQRFNGHIRIAETAEEFARACDDTLAAAHPRRHEEIAAAVAGESWSVKADYLSAHIASGGFLDERTCPVGQPARGSCAGVL